MDTAPPQSDYKSPDDRRACEPSKVWQNQRQFCPFLGLRYGPFCELRPRVGFYPTRPPF